MPAAKISVVISKHASRVRALDHVAAAAGAALLACVTMAVGALGAATSATPSAPRDGNSENSVRHWAYQPVRHPAPPAVNSSWPRTPIDAFILARLREVRAEPAPPADKRTLLRRATFDLTGLPPSADEVEAFERDASPDAFARVVDRLLASPRYGERWGRHWLDLVRYADTAGETADYPVPVAWRYRNWVIDAFNADKPYDQFLKEQIAGDILARQGPRDRYADRVTATGYLAISRRFGFDSENYHHLTIQDTIDTLGQSVLGLTLGCARCHAHKYDPVSMQDYYALYGIFESTRYAFPGSEQKQRSRSMVPLMPPEESQPAWRQFDARVATLARNLDRQKQPVPAAVLRSLDDLDGDFEMQAPAAGGSKGVLVQPWTYSGPIAVTADAQSPFKNLYPLGKVGASIPAGTNHCRVSQAIYPARQRGAGGLIRVNLDFRVTSRPPDSRGAYRFWIGSIAPSPAVEIRIDRDTIALRAGTRVETLRSLNSNQWHNLQLTLDLNAGSVSGAVGAPGDVVTFENQPLAPDWNGTLDFVSMESPATPGERVPGLVIDNLGVLEHPLRPVSRDLPVLASDSGSGPKSGHDDLNPDALNTELRMLAGLDGDFELQTGGSPPVSPWGPGPNSVVKVSESAQSPFRNLFAPGRLGVHLPNSGAYNGFGQTLTNRWRAEKTGRLFANFDFRCTSTTAGGDGSWRFYLGHGPGTSAAIELFINAGTFFRRSADQRDAVQTLRIGEWYQVQLELNLTNKSYTGSIASATNRTAFSGRVAAGWDGSVDYTFIDSYGHLAGVKPGLDADNFVVGESPLAPLGAPPIGNATAAAESKRRDRVKELRGHLAEMAGATERCRQELQTLLVDGPTELAYAVNDGTPRNARMQLRGEPDRPGDEVPRGFLSALGGGRLPEGATGSGRLELAEWLVRPENPLTARVMVNRLWQHHFGQGLVKTPNDFGARGQPPTHPELLDYLATQFVERGWSIKAMHRLILLSAAYQQQAAGDRKDWSDRSPEPHPPSKPEKRVTTAAAPAPDTFSPFARRRLSAEETRDSILLVSGDLDLAPGRGHPFPSPTGWGYTQHGPFSGVYDHNQRSVYLMVQRIKRHPFLALFDGADPNASTPERRTTTVPTQALYFLNDPFIHAKSEKFAARVQRAGADETKRIVEAFRLALSRPPTAVEQEEAAEFLASYRAELAAAGKGKEPAAIEASAWAAFGRVLFGGNEFLTVD